MVPSPFAFSRGDPCSLAGLYFNPVSWQSRGLWEPADMLIPQRLFRASPVLLTYLVKSAHSVYDEEPWCGPEEINQGQKGS
jgi:hypothetical protein